MSQRFPGLSRPAFLAGAGGALVAAAASGTAALGQTAGPSTRKLPPPSRVIGKMDPAGRFGAILDASEFNRAPRALHPADISKLGSQQRLRDTLAASASATRFILPNLPPVTMQGTLASMGFPGTCEAQSFGYALGMQTVTRAVSMNTAMPANQISPAWLFAWLTSFSNPYPGCGGSGALQYLDMLVSNGSASMAQVPYQPVCSALSAKSPSNPNGVDVDITHYAGADRFAIASYAALPNFLNQQAQYLELFKAYLRAGNAICFSGLVANGFYQPSASMNNGAFDPQSFIPKSGHGQLIVGFDDSLGKSGAFLIQNSMGTAWPNLGSDPLLQGRLWWTYESFFASQGFGVIATPIERNPVRSKFTPPILMSSVGPGVPVATLVEAVRGNDTGPQYTVLVEHAFSVPVRIVSVQMSSDRAAEAAVGAHDAPTRGGFIQLTSRRRFAPGTYDVHIVANTIAARGVPAKRIEYTAKVALR